MPNYNKSFNFRNGVQVDEDDLIVRGSLVGIGTTIPTEALDVRGTAKVVGLLTAQTLSVTGVSTFTEIRIGTGITLNTSGIISATKFFGDGSTLSDIPTSQWKDINVGAGITSIYAAGNVGVGTTDPGGYTFLVGGNPDVAGKFGVGIGSNGDINVSGSLTATNLTGAGANITNLNASNLVSGTVPAAQFPDYIDISGVATVAQLKVSVGSTFGGISTFIGNIDANGALDVGGEVTVGTAVTIGVAGVSTFSKDVFFAGGARAGGDAYASWDESENQFFFQDNARASFGDSGDLIVYHDGSNSRIKNSTGWLGILADTLDLTNANNDDLYFKGVDGGSVSLYWNGTKKFETTPTGTLTAGVATATSLNATDLKMTGISTFVDVNVSGTVTATTFVGNITGGVTGNATGLTGTPNIVVGQLSQTGVATLGVVTTATSIKANDFYGRLTGNVTGNATGLSGGPDVSLGRITAATQINAGVITATTGFEPDANKGSYLGKTGNTFANAHVADVTIGAGNDNRVTTSSGNLLLDGASGMVQVDDDLVVDRNFSCAGVATFSQALGFADGVQLTFGNLSGGDLRILHNASDSVISDQGAGHLKILSSQLEIKNAADNSLGAKFIQGADTELYYNNTKRLNTYAGGVNVVGTVTATSFVGDVFADNIRLGVADAQTVDTSTGNLQLSASSGTVNASSDVFKVSNKTDLVGNIHVGSGGNKLFVNGSNGRVGIGTSVPTEEFQIIKDSGSLTVDLVSRTGGVTLGIGQSVGADGNATATFQHNASDLDITNRATGNVNVTLAGGTGINTTAFLHVQHGTTKRVSIGYSGVVGINKALPDHALDIVGSAKVTGNANFTGIVTMGSGGNQVTFGSGTAAVTGSFNGPLFSGVTGVSTIHRLEGNHISVASTISTLGIGSFATALAIGSTDRMHKDEKLNVIGHANIKGGLLLRENGAKCGIGTTGWHDDTRPGTEPANLPAVDYGALQVYGAAYFQGTGLILSSQYASLDDSSTLIRTNDNRSAYNPNYKSRIGIQTHVARCGLDAGMTDYILPGCHYVRSDGIDTKEFMKTNLLNQTLQVANGAARIVPGALIFYEPKNRLEVNTGAAATGSFCGVATLTQNTSNFDSFVPPRLSTSDRNTMTGAGGIPAGAIIYNTSDNKLQVYSGSGTSWSNLH